MSQHFGDPLVAGPTILAAVLFGGAMLLTTVATMLQAATDATGPPTVAGVDLREFAAGMAFLAAPSFFALPAVLTSIRAGQGEWYGAFMLGITAPFTFAGLLYFARSTGRVEPDDRSLLRDAFGASVVVLVSGGLCAVFYVPLEYYVFPAIPIGRAWLTALWVLPFAAFALGVVALIAARGTTSRKGGRGVRTLFDRP